SLHNSAWPAGFWLQRSQDAARGKAPHQDPTSLCPILKVQPCQRDIPRHATEKSILRGGLPRRTWPEATTTSTSSLLERTLTNTSAGLPPGPGLWKLAASWRSR